MTTSARFNLADVLRALPPGGGIAAEGGELSEPVPKDLEAIGCTDADVTAAVAEAAAIFVDYPAQESAALDQLVTLLANLGPALAQGKADAAQIAADCAAYPTASPADQAAMFCRLGAAVQRLINNTEAVAVGTNYLIQHLGIIVSTDTGPTAVVGS